jgi:ubiquinone/menaquinone biosynthesis C-methylase UbiE
MDEITLRQKMHYENFEALRSRGYDKKYGGKKSLERSLVIARKNDISRKKVNCSLDLGCGTGTYTGDISKYSKHTYAIDLCDNWIRKARNKYRSKKITFICGDAQSLPFESQKFDIIYCYNAFYHIYDRKKAIAEAARVLKSGGELRFEVYNILHPFVFIRYLQNFFLKNKVRTYGSNLFMLKKMLNKNGLTISKVKVVSRIEATETVKKEVPGFIFRLLYRYRNIKSKLIIPMRLFIHCKKILK